jgi:hypothetical protein
MAVGNITQPTERPITDRSRKSQSGNVPLAITSDNEAGVGSSDN